MAVVKISFRSILLWYFLLECQAAYKVERYELFMPNAKPTKPDTYLCSPIKIDASKSYYIVGFEPKANHRTVHHMLLYGCLEPGSTRAVWNCGEMSYNDDSNEIDDDELVSVPCKQNSSIIYAWAKDAPMLKLPKDVGFKIGVNTPIRYLVLQIHYAHVEPFSRGRTDASGIYLYYTERPMNKLAGVLLMGTGGSIAPLSTESMETACNITEPNKVLHPFAYRTHTHALGVQVSGYRVRYVDGIDHWTLLGRRNPQLPQMFYPIANDVELEYGDYVAASCKMVNRRNRITFIGSTGQDEMCNFYLMYWTDDGLPLQTTYCFTKGAPYYYWDHQFKNIPLPEVIIGERFKFA